jgi:hypothetical protein
VSHQTVHPVQGKGPTPRTPVTREGNLAVVRNVLRRAREFAGQAFTQEIDAALECLEDLVEEKKHESESSNRRASRGAASLRD